ncbi:hypothetical protein [Streptosporangium carneum]|uniref:Uncharacterized protein n=1 Tax=Streptosporangium carneum TaxID=47481 RepID=A0A9W6MG66_9ACTN|nr:hypothetical protein [Streptosporangium carneum]GLK12835.1 hypothetical protein GCM10017600_62450 [Streptosporangium carneum]
MNDRPGRNEDRLVYRNTDSEVNVPSQRIDEVTPDFREPHREDAPAARHDAPEGGPHGERPDDRRDGLSDDLRGPLPGHAPDRDPLNPAYQVDPSHQTDPEDPANPAPATAGQAERPGPAHPAHTRPLFDQDSEDVRRRWQEVQASFVDDPRDSVERADSLVTEITDSLRAALEARTSDLQGRWKGAERNDTEDLRTALRDYRALLEQLLDLSTGKR